MTNSVPIYNATIKKLIVGFASLFDDIKYYSDDPIPKLIKVPINWGPREKWLAKVNDKSSVDIANQNSIELKPLYPKMAFDLSSFNYAPERATNPQNKIFSEEGAGNFSINRAPYDFIFNLYISVKKFEDGLKIIEQIVPYFTPEYSITISDTNLGIKDNIPVILNSNNYVINYESDFTTSRDIEWTLSFTMKAYIYPPIISIEQTNPITGTICTTIGSYPGLVTFSGSGTSNPICSGGATTNFTYTLTGYLNNTVSNFTGTFTGYKSDSSTYTINLTCQIIIQSNILYAEVFGTTTNNVPIKGITFTFNLDLTQNLSNQICVPIAGTVSCSNSGKYRLIKRTKIDVGSSQVDNYFERLISEVVPFTANKIDDHIIQDSIQDLNL